MEYSTKKTEEKIRKFWEKEKIYKFDFKSKKPIYSIDTPPPYISGKMHIGHAFSYSQQDFIVRFQRMSGKNIFYPFGTDDNGLPTERYVEKLKNIQSQSMLRAEFIELCLKVLKNMTPGFVQDYKNLGISCDYDISYSTIDKHSQKISQSSFIDLFRKKEIYSKKFPTLWCPECQTSIAQAELEDKENSTLFSTLKFECQGKDLLIATTRPELLGACVAVFVNPKDNRYKNLIGKKTKGSLFNHEVPIIADESADLEKGTGVLMICSYGDKFDVEAINKYKLKPKIILEKNGVLNIGRYNGLKIEQAREKILKDLEEKNLIKEQKKVNNVVNCHDKCGTPIEFLETEQWFIKTLDKKKELINQGNKIKWHPEFMHKRYNNWVNGLEWDWSISRERHFGVPIPLWKCECGKIILPKEYELPIDPLQIKRQCPKCKKQATGESRVLDTWATSSMTPQIASELVKGKLKIPFSLRPQAHDIIRTWAFYTILKSYLHEKEIPWKDIVISGFVKLGKEKMSKSKGTGIDPQKVLDEYGADALRFWAAGSKLGNDSDYQEKDLINGAKFINKLSNASKFVFMNLKDYKNKKLRLEKIDKWMLEKTKQAVENAKKNYLIYNISGAKREAEQFFWHDFCDNYLEIVKKRIYQGKGNEKLSAQYTLYNSLLAILKMIAPIMPFIAEEIYQEHFTKFEKEKSIHLSQFPVVKINEKTDVGDLFLDILSKIRQEKSNAKKPMNCEIVLALDKKTLNDLKDCLKDLTNVANAKEIKEGKEFEVKFV